MINYKNFVLVLTSYKCNKNCPYCIAKIDNLPEIEEDFNLLQEQIIKFEKENIKFEYFVLSGNGEPSLYTYENLKKIKDIVDNTNIFKEKRIQTSGNLFFENDKYDLFKSWFVEVTRVDKLFDKDSNILKYKDNYLETINYKNSKIRLNIVLLKNTISNLNQDILYYVAHPNIYTIALKILDKNEIQSLQNEWIKENAIEYENIQDILEIMKPIFGVPTQNFNNYLWTYKGTQISMYNNKNYNTEKTLQNFMWYGNKKLK